ncbi:MAG: helix-turn-helix domain-containing protein [Bacteroidia bacterium]|nr:helix-turn-helix domain-containing protein [Bacteroidia bacterium]
MLGIRLILLFLAGLLATTRINAYVSQLLFSRITAEDGLCDNQVLHIMQLPDERMLITTQGNINIYDGINFSHIHRTHIEPYHLEGYHGYYHVYVDIQQMVWIKNTQSLMCFDLKQNCYEENIPQLIQKMWPEKSKVSDVFVDTDYHLWLLSGRELWNDYTGKTITLNPAFGELQDVDVCGTFGYLFFSTGIVVCLDIMTSNISYTEVAYTEYEAAKYSHTSMVVRSSDGKFYQIRNGSESIFLCFDTNNRTWQSLFAADFTMHTLAVKDVGNIYFTSAQGLWRYNVKSNTRSKLEKYSLYEGAPMSASANTISFDRQGGVWVGTYHDGLLYAHPDRFPFHTQPKASATFPMQSHRVVDSRGYIWEATTDGLALTMNGVKRMIYSEDGLSNDCVCAIVEDMQNRMWVSTVNGISCIEVMHGEVLKINSYHASDGVLRGSYNSGMAQLLANGTIEMEGRNGTTIFDPEEVMHMRSIQLNPILKRITMSENNVTLDFSALNYAFPQHTHYKYTLVQGGDSLVTILKPGINSSYIDAKGALHLDLLKLTPGEYRLKVEAALDADSWTGRAQEVCFEILPPWWQSTCAYAAYAILTIIVVVSGVSLHSHNQRKRMLRQLKEERLMARIEGLMEQCARYEDERQVQHIAEEKQENEMEAQDAAFLKKAIALVEMNLGKQYSVEHLSSDLCMERTGLYKRLSAIVDKSPSLFMRSIRLSHAARLIREGNHSLAEIATLTGFSSASYLSRCFQEEYGCKPSEYAR